VENKQGSDNVPPRVVFFKPLITGFQIIIECPVCREVFGTSQIIVGGLPVCVYDCPSGHRFKLHDEFFSIILNHFYPPTTDTQVTDLIRSKAESWYKDFKLEYLGIDIGSATERMMTVLIGQEEFSKAASGE